LKKQFFLCAFILSFLAQSVNSQALEKLDGIAATVGDEMILQSELDAYIMMRLGNNEEQKPDTSLIRKYRKTFLNELIDGKILIAHAKQDTNIVVSNQEVESALNNHINSICQQNNIPLENLEQIIQQQQGISMVRFKSEARRAIKEQLLSQKLKQSFFSTIKVNKQDVVNFYNQYKDSLPKAGESVLLSKISIKIPSSEKNRQLAFDKIKSIKKKLDQGEDFGEVAKKHSESPDGESGGDLGFISKGTLSELAFEEKVFSLATGQISEPFETRLGFHIINVTQKQDQKVHVRQILVKVLPPDEDIKNIMTRLDSIKTNCKTSEDFIACVKKFSDDNATKVTNGSLGWITVLELNPTLNSIVDTFPAGTISMPLKEDNSYSIYRIDDRAKSRALTIENDYAFLYEKTRDIASQKKLITLVTDWRKEMLIEIKE
jgi:peptidyl-prolyl cis-trans isomerase SurA